LDDHLSESRNGLFYPPASGEPAKGGYGQYAIDKHACAKRDEQKNAQTPEFAISHGMSFKLAENHTWHKRF
jgi:hypothetical protein